MHTRSGFRSLITFIAICCSLIVSLKIFGQANAQADAQITLKAEAGFDGYAKADKWIPVHVTLENQGADVNEASLQVSYKDYSGTSTVYSLSSGVSESR